MDIRQWLYNTAHGAPPEESESLRSPDFLQNLEKHDGITHRYRRRSNHTASDSASVKPHRGRRKRGAISMLSHPSDHILHVPAKAALSSPPLSRRSSSTRAHSPARRYEKRARHKTKPDRYEPKPRKQAKDRTSREEKSKTKPRNVRGNGDGGRTTGLSQTFQFKNGPKKSRLTLKPQANGGLFKHGRASAQIPGRGAGLPDLAFNEMRFLQKPQEHQDRRPSGTDPQRPGKKDRKHQHDEEISAFFAATKADIEDKRNAVRSGKPGDPLGRPPPAFPLSNQEGRRPVIPPVELPEQPFLGFGSRGAPHNSADQAHPSTPCFTWSASPAAQPGNSASRRRHASALEGSHHSTRRLKGPTGLGAERLSSLGRAQGAGRHVDTADVRFTREALRDMSTGPQRRRGPAHGQEQRALPTVSHQQALDRSQTKTTSQPLPKLGSSPPPRFQDPQAQHNRHDEYQTSEILRIRRSSSRPPSTALLHLRAAPMGQHAQSDKENDDPTSSDSFGKLLRKAEDALTRQRHPPQLGEQGQLTSARQRSTGAGIAQPLNIEENERADLRHNFAPAQRLVPQYDRNPPTAKPARPPSFLKSRAAASIFLERQAQRLARTWSPQRFTHTPAPLPTALGDDTEIVDNDAYDEAARFIPNLVCANAQQVEVIADREYMYDDDMNCSGAFEDHVERPGRDMVHADFGIEPELTTVRQAIRGRSLERDFHSEQSDGGGHADPIMVDEFAGFWKPHKLY